MRTEVEKDLLQAIFDEMLTIKKALAEKDGKRVGREEFAQRLNIEPETLDARIRIGRYQKPMKDGRKSYWFSDYVQSIVMSDDTENSRLS